MDKKKIGACGAGFIAALMYGGAQLMTMESRLEALEGLHPELEGEDEAELHGAEPYEEESPPALGKPGMSAPPIEEPEGLEDETDGDAE